MKKFLVLTLVMLLLVATVVPALAGGKALQNNKTEISGKQLYALAGYIREIDKDKKTITVEVMVGNRLGDDYLKQKVIIVTKTDTRLLISGGTVITFDKFSVGNTVSSNGILTFEGDKPVFTADRITRDTSALNW